MCALLNTSLKLLPSALEEKFNRNINCITIWSEHHGGDHFTEIFWNDHFFWGGGIKILFYSAKKIGFFVRGRRTRAVNRSMSHSDSKAPP
jgi:hypothetical protein